MYITFCFNKAGGSARLTLPRTYLHLFHGLVYSIMTDETAAFLHDTGYNIDGHSLKMFAMGWPITASPSKTDGDTISFSLPLALTLATPVDDIADALIRGIRNKSELHIGGNSVICERVIMESRTVSGTRAEIRTISPITCYERIDRNGQPYTIYFRPEERDFSKLIHANLVRKFAALHPDRTMPEGDVTIRVLGDLREMVANFEPNSSFPTKGWSGRFVLEGPEELLNIALNCGLGSRNSMGWGCVLNGVRTWNDVVRRYIISAR